MKYTEQEIVDKFSSVDFDKTGLKKQAIYNRVTQACAQRREKMKKKFSPLFATAVVLLVAVPTFVMMFGAKREIVAPQNPAQTVAPVQEAQASASAITPVQNVQEETAPVPTVQKTEGAVQTVQHEETDAAAEAVLPAVPAAARAESDASGQNIFAAGAVSSGANLQKGSASAAARDRLEEERAFRMRRSGESVRSDGRMAQKRAFAAQASRVGTRCGPDSRCGGGASLGATYGRESFVPPMSIVWEDEGGKISQDSKEYAENGFKKAALEPLSTFSADVDTASYNMLKEQIRRGFRIDKDGVRTEAIINNFAYNHPAPKGSDPVSITVEYAPAAWNAKNQLVKIGVKAKELDRAHLPQSNLVFLIDVSGSMSGNNRLPLVKKSFKMLLNQLDENDIVSIVTYASGVDVKLDGVKVKDKKKIETAIDGLVARGATAGEEGLKRAYEVAKKNFLRKGNNRIIIASDGDFNVGNSTVKALEKQVSDAKESGVFISALGFGMGNYRDNMMETIADKGNGNYAYINDLKSAQKALVREFGGTMFTVAKDVKLQVEFNPAVVEEYRLIGYEKRLLSNEDFNDDTKDAAEMGSGHTVTVFYEIRPKGSAEKMNIDELKYTRAEHTNTDEVLTVKMRYKDPQGDESKLISKALLAKDKKELDQTSDDFRFATAAAAFGQLVRDGEFLNGFTAHQIADLAADAKGKDDSGDRAEFVQIVRTYADTPQE